MFTNTDFKLILSIVYCIFYNKTVDVILADWVGNFGTVRIDISGEIDYQFLGLHCTVDSIGYVMCKSMYNDVKHLFYV